MSTNRPHNDQLSDSAATEREHLSPVHYRATDPEQGTITRTDATSDERGQFSFSESSPPTSSSQRSGRDNVYDATSRRGTTEAPPLALTVTVPMMPSEQRIYNDW